MQMSRILNFLAALALPLFFAGFSVSAGASAASKAFPVISASSFAQGQEFVWEYFENGQLYSAEKYTVLESNPEKTLFLMSTRLAGESDFKSHHRLEVSVKNCLKAYQNPRYYRPWKLRLSYWNQDRWQPLPGLNSNLAFEEKFNCNPHLTKIPGQKAVLKSHEWRGELETLFQFRQGESVDRTSWYYFEGPNAGILGYKPMRKPQSSVQYEIHYLKPKNSGFTSLTDSQTAPH